MRAKVNAVFVVAATTAVLLLSIPPGARAQNNTYDDDDFIKAAGNKLVRAEANTRYMFSGSSLAARAVSTTSPAEFYGEIKARNHNVARLWLFDHSPWGQQVGPINTAPGVFHTEGFDKIDAYIAEAEKYDIRIIYTLEGNWIHTPGIPLLVLWSQTARDIIEDQRLIYTTPEGVEIYNEPFNYQRVERNMSLEERQDLAGQGYNLTALDPADEGKMNDPNSIHVIVPARTLHDSAQSIRCLDGDGYLVGYGICMTNVFWSDDLCRQYFKEYLDTVLNHTNRITGRKYKDEPAILCWELCNEGRNKNSGNEGKTDLERTREWYDWCREMSDHIAAIDTNHLIATGESGNLHFTDPATHPERMVYDDFPDAGIPVMDDLDAKRQEAYEMIPADMKSGWPWLWWLCAGSISDGTDWYANHSNANITMSGFHYFKEPAEFMATVSKRDLGKPIYVGEYMYGSDAELDRYYDIVRRTEIDGVVAWAWDERMRTKHEVFRAWQKSLEVTIEPDTTPPALTVVSPTGSVNTAYPTVVVTSDEFAQVRWSKEDKVYDQMENQLGGGFSKEHSAGVFVEPGANTIYVRSKDRSGNTNDQSTVITFTSVENIVLAATLVELSNLVLDGTDGNISGIRINFSEARDFSTAVQIQISVRTAGGQVVSGQGSVTAKLFLTGGDNPWISENMEVQLLEGVHNDLTLTAANLADGTDLSDIRSFGIILSTSGTLVWNGSLALDDFAVVNSSGGTILSDDFSSDNTLEWERLYVNPNSLSVLTELSRTAEHEFNRTGIRRISNPSGTPDLSYDCIINRNSICLRFSSVQDGPVEASLVTVSGRIIARSSLSKRAREVRMDNLSLSSGIYFIHLESGVSRRVERVLIP